MNNVLPVSTCPVPLFYYDTLLVLLDSEEWKVFSFAVRHIWGFEDRRQTRRRRISVSTFENGYGDFPGCGLGRKAIIKALKGLTDHRVILKVGKATAEGQEYELPIYETEVDLARLEDRQAERTSTYQRITEKARAASIASRCVTDTDAGVSETPAEPEIEPEVFESDLRETGVSDTPMPESIAGVSDTPVDNNLLVSETHQERCVTDTDAGVSNTRKEINSQTNLQIKEIAPAGASSKPKSSTRKKKTESSGRAKVQHKELIDPVKKAIAAAFIEHGIWSAGDVGRGEWVHCEEAACDLCDRENPVLPEEVSSLVLFVKDIAEKDDWDDWTPRALGSRVAKWRSQQSAPAANSAEKSGGGLFKAPWDDVDMSEDPNDPYVPKEQVFAQLRTIGR